VCDCTESVQSLGRLNQEDHEFEAHLGYIAESFLKRRKKDQHRWFFEVLYFLGWCQMVYTCDNTAYHYTHQNDCLQNGEMCGRSEW
jgi:hypothetical protein